MSTLWVRCCIVALVAGCASRPAQTPTGASTAEPVAAEPSKANQGPPAAAAPAAEPDPAPTSPEVATRTSEAEVTELEALRGAACACTDKQCADQTLAQFGKLVERIRDKGVSGDHRVRITEATKDLTICLMKRGESVEDIKAAARTGAPEDAAQRSADAAPPTSETEVQKLEAIKAAACACTDKRCADQQLAEFGTLVRQIKGKDLASEAQGKRITLAARDLTLCLVKHGETFADVKAATR